MPGEIANLGATMTTIFSVGHQGIHFEIDTDENVQNEYDVDYYARPR